MTSKDNLSVKKRNGRGSETLDIEKIHSMVGFATENITGVSASHVEINSGIPVSYTHLTLPTTPYV